MDDARIRQLAEEVLSQLRAPSAAEPSDLESRIAALEAAVRALQPSAAPAASTTVVVTHTQGPHAHPSLALLGPSGGGKGQCVLEPDKACTGSGQCRTFGH